MVERSLSMGEVPDQYPDPPIFFTFSPLNLCEGSQVVVVPWCAISWFLGRCMVFVTALCMV